jgi:hypothetical protein
VGLRLIRHRASLAAALFAAGALVGCMYMPEAVSGLPTGSGWVALPLRAWIGERGIRAEAIAACIEPDCAPRAAVGVFRATGADARALVAILTDPEALTRFVAARDGADVAPQRRAIRTVATIERANEGGASGFVARLSRADGARPAHVIALGRETADGLRFVIVVGESPEGVRMIAREAAAAFREHG